MLERINKLLRELEWSRRIAGVETCPSCHQRQHFGPGKGGHAFPDCELKACLDDIEAALAKAEWKREVQDAPMSEM